MKQAELFDQILQKKSYLCVGLDTDIRKIPPHLLKFEDPVLEFNRRIIEATSPYCVAYKPNIAFYEARGSTGWTSLSGSMKLIPDNIFTIADAKRGDIGNTSHLYARTFFEKKAAGLNFDAITVAPYMGHDSIEPFLTYPEKWVILLGLTSNNGSLDFQHLKIENGKHLYQEVLEKSQQWAGPDQMMYVIGATQSDSIQTVRQIIPDHFLLVPGIGAQGGDLAAISKYGLNKRAGLLVNASRSIIYASSGKDFAEAAACQARAIQQEMARYLDQFLV